MAAGSSTVPDPQTQALQMAELILRADPNAAAIVIKGDGVVYAVGIDNGQVTAIVPM